MNKTKLLVVDDNALIRNIISDMLQSMDYEVIEAQNGEDGIEMAKNEDPCLMLMDIHMPGIGGIKAMKEVKRIPGKEDMPIVALTASSKEDDRDMLLGEGFDDYIRKPPNIKELTRMIDNILNKG